MKNIWGLRQRDVDLRIKQEVLHKKSVAEGRAFTSQEQTEWEQLKEARARLQAAIVEVEAELDHDRRSGTGVIIPTGGTGAWERPASDSGKAPFKPKGRRYRDLFPTAALSSDGFRDFNEFCNAWHVAGQQFDPRLRAAPGRPHPGATRKRVPPDSFSAVP